MNHQERGAAALEAVLLMPLILGMIAVVYVAGRSAEAAGLVEHVAAEAARAAALAQTHEGASAAAAEVAAANVADAGLSCVDMGVSVGGSLAPGGTVTATVSCEATWSDLTGLRLPGGRSFSATSTEPVDLWRGGATVAGDT